MKTARVLVLAVVILMISSSFAFAQYPSAVTGMILAERDFAKINDASLNLGGIKVVLKNGIYTITTGAGTFKINAKTGKIVK